MSHKEKSELLSLRIDSRDARTRSGARPGNCPGERRSCGWKPSGTNLDRRGGSDAATSHDARSQSRSKNRRGSMIR
jgi:hypothetical protein